MTPEELAFIQSLPNCKEVLSELARAYEQYPKFRRYVDDKVPLYACLMCGFDWIPDLKGDMFWLDLYSKLIWRNDGH